MDCDVSIEFAVKDLDHISVSALTVLFECHNFIGNVIVEIMSTYQLPHNYLGSLASSSKGEKRITYLESEYLTSRPVINPIRCGK